MALSLPRTDNNMKGLVPSFTNTAKWGQGSAVPNAIYQFLHERLCAVGDTLYMRNNADDANGMGNWRDVSTKRFMPAFMRAYGGVQQHQGQSITITKEDVKQFIEAELSVLQTITYAPHAGSYVVCPSSKILGQCGSRNNGGFGLPVG